MNSDIKYLSDNNYISHIKNQYLICISEESFNNLFNEEKEDLLNALYRFIINEEIYLYQIPSFLLKERLFPRDHPLLEQTDFGNFPNLTTNRGIYQSLNRVDYLSFYP